MISNSDLHMFLLINFTDIISYCKPEQLNTIMKWCEQLQRITPDYDMIPHKLLSYIKLHVELYQKISNALHKGPPHIEVTYH